MTSSSGTSPSSSFQNTVDVALGDRTYSILIGTGLLETAGKHIKPLLARNQTVIVTDHNVAEAVLPKLQKSLDEAEIAHRTITLPAGETSKSFDTLARLTDFLLDARVERNDMIIALGGGVIGDLTGFAASVLRRGIDFIQIPTSLLAQVDSSVGGKTGINTRFGKNLVGAFHQPRLVLADVGVLSTLPPRELRAGYAEVVKYGLIDQPDFFEWLEANGAALLAGDTQLMVEAVAVSCKAKAAIVAEDERERGRRALLNLGHTFGHALEAETGYSDRLVHGEAVSIGMCLAHEFSQVQGLASGQDTQRLKAHLKALGLPSSISDIPGAPVAASALVDHMYQDKKAIAGALTFILTKGIGQAFVATDVDPATLLDFLATRV
jgi:3-dehydroquinate synthase